ncbi:MAG TPA: hypothetical protein VFG21_06270 [Xanthomonadaceae bacterium]|nr:hypothetical protein [Xanthomonadaceae bacterium]
MNRNCRSCAIVMLAVTAACLTAPVPAQDPPAAKAEAIHLDTEAMDWEPSSVPGFPEGAWRKLLHSNPENGAGAVLRRHPKGYVEPRHWHSTANHGVYMLSGRVRIGETVAGPGHFFYAPAGHVHGPIEALEDVEFLLWTDGPLDLHLVEAEDSGTQ